MYCTTAIACLPVFHKNQSHGYNSSRAQPHAFWPGPENTSICVIFQITSQLCSIHTPTRNLVSLSSITSDVLQLSLLSNIDLLLLVGVVVVCNCRIRYFALCYSSVFATVFTFLCSLWLWSKLSCPWQEMCHINEASSPSTVSLNSDQIYSRIYKYTCPSWYYWGRDFHIWQYSTFVFVYCLLSYKR